MHDIYCVQQTNNVLLFEKLFESDAPPTAAHVDRLSHVLILRMFESSACDVLEFYLRQTDVKQEVMTRYGGLGVVDKIADRSCYDNDFKCLLLLLNCNRNTSIADYVITSKLNPQDNGMSTILGFTRAVFKSEHNKALKQRTRQYMFDFHPEVLIECLRAGVDPTEMTSKADAADLRTSYSKHERAHFVQHIETLVRAASSEHMLAFLHETYRHAHDISKENTAVQSLESLYDARIRNLFNDAGFDLISSKKTTQPGSIEIELEPSEKTPALGDLNSVRPMPSLRQLCRVAIRHSVSTNVIHAASSLGLPPALQRYVLLTD